MKWPAVNTFAAGDIWLHHAIDGALLLALQSCSVLRGPTLLPSAALVFRSYMLDMRRLPRSRGVPTSFHNPLSMLSNNRVLRLVFVIFFCRPNRGQPCSLHVAFPADVLTDVPAAIGSTRQQQQQQQHHQQQQPQPQPQPQQPQQPQPQPQPQQQQQQQQQNINNNNKKKKKKNKNKTKSNNHFNNKSNKFNNNNNNDHKAAATTTTTPTPPPPPPATTTTTREGGTKASPEPPNVLLQSHMN